MEWVSVNTGKYQISPGIFKCVEFHLLKGYRILKPKMAETIGLIPKQTETNKGDPQFEIFTMQKLGHPTVFEKDSLNFQQMLYLGFSMDVQRGNATSIMGTLGPLRKLEDFFDVISPEEKS